MNKWWGYLHVDGTVHAKRYFDEKDIIEARESDFCAGIHGPFEIPSSGDAATFLMEYFFPTAEDPV
jgi:hypothetical protein